MYSVGGRYRTRAVYDCMLHVFQLTVSSQSVLMQYHRHQKMSVCPIHVSEKEVGRQ